MCPETFFGIGLDLIDLKRFTLLYGGDDRDLLARCFTATELSEIGAGPDRVARLASRMAVKEASYKAMGGGISIAWTDFEVRSTGNIIPTLVLHGNAGSTASALGISRFIISLTHSDSSAAAVVVAFSNGPK